MKNITQPKLAVPLLVCALFAACGGGGSSAPIASTSGSGDSAPSPAPSPTPSPSPSPSPSPAPGPAPSPAPAPAPTPAPTPTQLVVANTNATASSVAAMPDGSQIAAWSDASGVFAQHFSSAGNLGAAVQLASAGTVSGAAALAGGGYAVEYQTADAVYVQIVNASGQPLASPITLVTSAQLAPTLPGDTGYTLKGGSGIVPAPDGSFLAGYRRYHFVRIPGDSAFDIVAQRFDAAGAAIGSPQPLSDAYFEADLVDGGSALPSGGFVFAHDGRYGNTLVTVRDTALNWLGNYSSPMTGVNQVGMDAAALANGKLVAIWTQSGSTEVQGQMFHVDAAAPGGFAVDTGVIVFAGVQGPARVLALPGSRFLLTWASGQAQVFDSSGQPVSAVMQLASDNVAVMSSGQVVALAQEGAQLVAHYYAI